MAWTHALPRQTSNFKFIARSRPRLLWCFCLPTGAWLALLGSDLLLGLSSVSLAWMLFGALKLPRRRGALPVRLFHLLIRLSRFPRQKSLNHQVARPKSKLTSRSCVGPPSEVRHRCRIAFPLPSLPPGVGVCHMRARRGDRCVTDTNTSLFAPPNDIRVRVTSRNLNEKYNKMYLDEC
jgi:hypothetical protein